MTKQEILAKMLIEPKELELLGGKFTKDSKAQIYTNTDVDMSFLLELAGFEEKAQKIELDTALSVLMIGEKSEEIGDL